MIRKILACLLVAAAFAAAIGAIPGLIENIAYACDPSNPSCNP